MTKQYDVVIAGDVYCDLIFTGLPRMPLSGEELFATDFDIAAGGVFITAITLRRLGMRVGLFTHIGNDPFSRFVLEAMEEEDIDLSFVQKLDRSVRTITASFSFDEDRNFVSFTDPRPPQPTPAEVLSRCRFRHIHVHWLGQIWDEPGLVQLAKEQGATISLDCQCCPEVMARPDVPEKLGLVDVFMPNRAEALQVTGTDDPEEALRKLAAWSSTAIVKLGREGAIAMHKGRVYRFPPMPVNVVDTTGAGDAFAGGYLFGMLSEMPFEQAMRAATICGGLSVTARGGATNVPMLPQLHEWLGRDWGAPL